MHPTVSPCTQAIWSSSIGTGGRHASERVDFFIGMPTDPSQLLKNAQKILLFLPPTTRYRAFGFSGWRTPDNVIRISGWRWRTGVLFKSSSDPQDTMQWLI
jgi:hypothetical protein